jgi:hypothetical protein
MEKTEAFPPPFAGERTVEWHEPTQTELEARTLDWLLRTQAFTAPPAVRHRKRVDDRSVLHTRLALGAVLIGVLGMLVLVPRWRQNALAEPQARHGVRSRVPSDTAPTPYFPSSDAFPPGGSLVETAQPRLPSTYVPPPGVSTTFKVAPYAPIWLEKKPRAGQTMPTPPQAPTVLSSLRR